MPHSPDDSLTPDQRRREIASILARGILRLHVTHILGLCAFGSPLLTEQIIGRGLRRTNFDILHQPLEERPDGGEETVDAFGIPWYPATRTLRSASRTFSTTRRTWCGTLRTSGSGSR